MPSSTTVSRNPSFFEKLGDTGLDIAREVVASKYGNTGKNAAAAPVAPVIVSNAPAPVTPTAQSFQLNSQMILLVGGLIVAVLVLKGR